MSNLSVQNPLFQPVQFNGQIYFTSQYFHQQYRANSSEGGKYEKLKNFNALIRSIETYENYVERGDIIELTWEAAKSTGLNFKPVFESISYKPLMLINATAQVALTHHLDDEVSKSVSVSVNEGIANSQPKKAANLTNIKMHLLFAKHIEESLRLSETSKIRMYAVIAEENGLPTKLLPEYGTTEGLTKAMSVLLKEHNVNMSAKAANKILESLGYLQTLERRSTGSTMKEFKSITEKGLAFGRNETPPESPNQTQPRWYVSTFHEVVDILLDSSNQEVA